MLAAVVVLAYVQLLRANEFFMLVAAVAVDTL
jgi:hypothetical protein